MKVIGRTKDGFILEASSDEAAKLTGARYYGLEEFRLNIGDEIQVSEMYRQLDELSKMNRDVARIQGLLTNCCKSLEVIPPVLSTIVEQKK